MTKVRWLAFAMVATILMSSPIYACTNIVITGAPNSNIVASGRTFEFTVPIYPKIVMVPRNQSWTSVPPRPGQASGMSWTNQLGFVGLSVFGDERILADGINERGLSAAVLWLDEAGYMQPKGSNDLSSHDLVSYILGNYSSASEAKAAISNLNVYGAYLSAYEITIPLHLIVTDAKGYSFIAEWVGGQLKLYDNTNVPLFNGTLANSPVFPQQIKQFAKYKNLTCAVKGKKYSLHGLPGNSEHTSRFARAYKLRDCVEVRQSTGEYMIKSQDASIERTTQILGRVEVPRGEVVYESGTKEGQELSFTRMTLIRSHGEMDAQGKATSKLYYRTPDNQSLRVVDLSKIDFATPIPQGSNFSAYAVDSDQYIKAQDAIFTSR